MNEMEKKLIIKNKKLLPNSKFDKLKKMPPPV